MDALLDWWADMGVEADPAVIRAARKAVAAPRRPSETRKPEAPPARSRKPRTPEDWAEEAWRAAAAAGDIPALKAAIEAFDGSPLKAGAENTVVFDGVPGAPVMVIGEGPGAEEDRQGLPFVGKAGQLLDRMLAAIRLSRAENTLITNVNYWRPPKNRNPDPDELIVCRPFVDRLIELSAPKLIIAAGGVPTTSLLATKTGIMRLRGKPKEYQTPGGWSGPLVPIFHPAFLLRRPQEKARAWVDLQMIERMLREAGVELG
ncbi:MAG: uracil-DNA glycosylase [Pseudomonadota bacterium]